MSLFFLIVLMVALAFFLWRANRAAAIERYRQSVQRALARGQIDSRVAGYYLELVERMPSVAVRAPDPFAHQSGSAPRPPHESELTEGLADELLAVLTRKR